MTELSEITKFLDHYLKIDTIADSSFNGLQVEGTQKVKKIALAVDACKEVFIKAKDKEADFVLVHHGLFWREDNPHAIGVMKKRLELLIKNDISLYAVHLPLDVHKEVGNNITLAKQLGLEIIGDFASYHGVLCGVYGTLKEEMQLDEFIKLAEEKIGKITTKHLFGKERIKTVGVVSGGGAFGVNDMEKYGIDILLSGEPKHQVYNLTKDIGVNAIYAGHYTTETFGVIALGEKLKEEFPDIDIEFVDNPTGL
ncbi:MAG: Nif3-like dinuclear metal center hexameric protein [Methanosarcinales archaeon]